MRFALFACDGGDRPRPRAPPLSWSRARAAASRRTSPRSRPKARPGIRWRSPASSRMRSCPCAPTSSTSALWLMKTEGELEAALAMDATLRALKRALAGARNHRLSAPHLQPARRHLAQPVRARRRGLVLRRHAAWSWPSPATASTIWRCPAEKPRAQDRAQRSELRRLPDGERAEPSRAPLLRRKAGARGAESQTSAGRSTPRRRSPLASPPAFPTTSTGRTRSASRSRSARR